MNAPTYLKISARKIPPMRIKTVEDAEAWLSDRTIRECVYDAFDMKLKGWFFHKMEDGRLHLTQARIGADTRGKANFAYLATKAREPFKRVEWRGCYGVGWTGKIPHGG
jgi:hypothetical protein